MTLPAAQELGCAYAIEDYLRLVLEKRPHGTEVGWFFRGQRQYDWSLEPKIDRSTFVEYRRARGWTRRHHEERLLNDFRRGARPHVTIQPSDEWEWLAVAQHHGLATRLLDWTSNPLAALYFAVEDRVPYVDSAVWCYHHSGRGWSDCRLESPFAPIDVIEFRPVHLTPRITVQAGCFTAHPDPEAMTPHNAGALKKIKILGVQRDKLREELRRLGVERASLFPDLDGIALSVNSHLSGEGTG
jgi:hypothetical protein